MQPPVVPRPQDWHKDLQRILNDIRQQQCVLLLGPEALRINGRPVSQALREHLAQFEGQEVAFYYEHDGLYLFGPDTSKIDMQSDVSQFYRAQRPELGIAWQVAKLPVSLVISLNPDDTLADAMRSYGVDVRTAYYKASGAGVEQVAPPTREQPLVYNLFGSVHNQASLILDYDDLLGFFGALMGPTRLPPDVDAALNEARTFLFIGFRFDRWYAQALLHRLTRGEKGRRKITMGHAQPDEHTTAFLVNQFGIRFMEAGQDLLQLLLDEALRQDEAAATSPMAAPPLLRDLRVPGGADQERLLRMFTHPEQLPQVFAPLKDRTAHDPDTQQSVILLEARYRHWDSTRACTDSRDALVEINRIRYALLSIILGL